MDISFLRSSNSEIRKLLRLELHLNIYVNIGGMFLAFLNHRIGSG